jgi:AraC-like DNA-binding protein
MSLQSVPLSKSGLYLYESKHREKDLVKEHYHAVHQLLYVIGGRGSVTLDASTHEMREEQVAVILPYTRHAVISDSSLTLLVLAFDASILDSYVQQTLMRNYFQKSLICSLHASESNEMRLLLRKMLYDQAKEDQLNDLALRINMMQTLHVLARSLQLSAATDANSLRADRIKQLIDAQYFSNLSSQDIASRMGISTRYVNTIYKERFQMTPLQYLTEVRINHAKKLLVESEKDIATISFEVGYENLTTFYRVFKQTTGSAPNHYRQLHQNQASIYDPSE